MFGAWGTLRSIIWPAVVAFFCPVETGAFCGPVKCRRNHTCEQCLPVSWCHRANQQLVLLAALCQVLYLHIVMNNINLYQNITYIKLNLIIQKFMGRVPTAISTKSSKFFGFDSGSRGAACEDFETVHSAVGKCVSGTYAAQMGSGFFTKTYDSRINLGGRHICHRYASVLVDTLGEFNKET